MSRLHHTTGDGLATCRLLAVPTTEDASAVTCRLCLRALAAVAARVEAERDRRADHRPSVLDGPGRSEVGADGALAIARSIAGEPVTTGPRWGGVASAWEALVRAQAERRSIASASSPERFGRRGGASPGPTPTTPRETQTDLVDVEMARNVACVAMLVGEHELTAEQVLAIAQARIVGRVVRRPVRMVGGTIVEKRGTTCDLVAVSAEEIAEETGLTRHQVALVVRRVRAPFAAELARKGLIPARVARFNDGYEEQEESKMATPVGFDVEGWKEIGVVVGRSPKVCQELARRVRYPLPVTKYLGRAIAKRAELVAWVSDEIKSPRRAA